MDSLRAVSLIGITAIIFNFLLIIAAGTELVPYKVCARLFVLAILLPGIFSGAKLTDTIKGSRILKGIARIIR